MLELAASRNLNDGLTSSLWVVAFPVLHHSHSHTGRKDFTCSISVIYFTILREIKIFSSPELFFNLPALREPVRAYLTLPHCVTRQPRLPSPPWQLNAVPHHCDQSFDGSCSTPCGDGRSRPVLRVLRLFRALRALRTVTSLSMTSSTPCSRLHHYIPSLSHHRHVQQRCTIADPSLCVVTCAVEGKLIPHGYTARGPSRSRSRKRVRAPRIALTRLRTHHLVK